MKLANFCCGIKRHYKELTITADGRQHPTLLLNKNLKSVVQQSGSAFTTNGYLSPTVSFFYR